MRADDRVRILHMIDAAESVERFTAARTRADLETDEMLLFAVVHAVELIGEAASKVSDDTQAQASEIPWGDITGMRNRLIHGYFDVDFDILWKTVRDEIPPLLDELRALVSRP